MLIIIKPLQLMKNFNYYNRPKQDHINKKNNNYEQSDLLTTNKNEQ